MTRQQALNTIWQRLLVVLCCCLAISIGVLFAGDIAGVGVLVFVVGNIGGYVSVHRGVNELKDAEVIEMSAGWWPIIAPPFVGGILALVMYLLFMANILAGDLFPKFEADENSPVGLQSLLAQHATGMPAYAKLLFWSFVAGFNQKYVVDIINSIRAKP